MSSATATQEVLVAASAKVEMLGKPVIVKSTLELVQMVYRDPDLPLQVRLHAAKYRPRGKGLRQFDARRPGQINSRPTWELPAGNRRVTVWPKR